MAGRVAVVIEATSSGPGDGVIGAAHAASEPRSYAVMSLVGNTLHVFTVRPQVGARNGDGSSHHALPIAEPVFDTVALIAANAAITRAQPGAKIVLMMTQDAGLYEAQNAMFDAPEANKANRDFLVGLLKERKVSHVVLVTALRDNASFKLANGTVGSGWLEGLGFYIDDTTALRNTSTQDIASGMLGPFAYVKLRLVDADTLAVLGEARAPMSAIVTQPSAAPVAMDVWTGMDNQTKITHINNLLREAIDRAITPLLAN